jgi:hypothetical protein
VLIIPSSWGFPTSFLVSTTHQRNSNHTTIGVLVHNGMKITCVDLRSIENTKVREDILDALFDIYRFEIQVRVVVAKAMCMMVKSLSTWRSLTTKNKDKDF